MTTMIEKMADLEHQQWAHWTRYMLDNMTPENIERWRRQIDTPYNELSEGEKDSDRKWAEKSLECLREPTPEMLDAYMARYPHAEITRGQVIEDYKAMIDAALADKGEG